MIPGTLADEITRDEVIGKVTKWEPLKSFDLPGELAGGVDADPVTFVIYWKPSEIDNYWNVNNGKSVTDKYMIDGEYALHIDLGVHLKATQKVSESDSFGDDYDKLAPWTGLVAEKVPAEENGVITISTGEELAALAESVNSGNSYAGKTIQLGANIDLNNVAWTPIGTADNNFNGSFDGNGYTIYNLTVSGTEGVGLIGFAGNAAHIEEVKIVGANVSGNHWVGTVLGYGYLAANTLKKCHVEDATVICTPVLVNGVYDDGDKVGAVAGMAINGNILNNTAKNCVVMGYRDVGGIVGLAQAEDRTIYVQQNTVSGITLVYTGVLAEYADGTPNQNMDYFVGRSNPVGDYKVEVSKYTNTTEGSNLFELVATVVSTEDELSEALEESDNVVLVSDMEVTAPIEIAEGVETTLYLNGKELSGDVAKNAGAVLENSGELTIVGNGSGVLVNEAVNGGAVISNTGSLVLDGTTIEGASIGTEGYPSYAITSSGNLTIEEGTTISSDRGTLCLYGAGKTVINGGTFISNDIDRTLTSHVVYVEADSTNELTINGGTFQHLHAKTSGGVVINNWSQGTVYVNGGNFSGGNYWSESNLSTYGFGGSFCVTGGTYTHFKDAFLADGYKAIQKDGLYYVVAEQIDSVASDAKDLEEALNNADDVVLTDDLEFSSKDTAHNSGYGATGVTVDGGVLDGNGKTLTVNDANGTWDCAVNASAGTIKNLTVNGAFRGIFMSGATGDVYIDNVVLDDVCYTFNSDAGSKDYGVYISNSTLNGWTSYSNVHKEVVFTNCTFGQGTGGYKYAFMRPYNATVFEDCVFDTGFEIEALNTCLFINCYYGETLITEENVASLGLIVSSNMDLIKFPTKVTASDSLGSALTENKYVELTEDVTFASDINSDANIELNNNTMTMTSSDQKVSGNLNIKNGTVDVSGGYFDIRSAEGKEVVIENVIFNYDKKSLTYGNSTDRVGSALEFCPTAEGVKTVFVFKDCTFINSQVVFEAMSGKPGEFVATFENCTFTNFGNSDVIDVSNYLTGEITIKDCTFNMTATSNINIVDAMGSSTITVNFEGNNMVNGIAAVPTTDPALEGTVDEIKVFSTQSVKVASSSVDYVNGLDTVTVTGIAKK